MPEMTLLEWIKAGRVIPSDAGTRRELEELKQCILEYGMEIEQEHLLKGRLQQHV